MKEFRRPASAGKEWLLAGALGLVAAVLYAISLAECTYPGESAHLTAVWRGLDGTAVTQYPLLKAIAAPLGLPNWLFPLFGALAVALVCRLTSFFVRERIVVEGMEERRSGLGRIAGATAALVFMLTPAVREASTHLEPRIFDFLWLLVALAPLLLYPRVPAGLANVLPVAVGVMFGLGGVDSPLFLAVAPLAAIAVWAAAAKRGCSPIAAFFGFVLPALAAFFAFAFASADDFGVFARAFWRGFELYWSLDGWIFIAAFSTLPFAVSLFSSYKAYNERSGLSQWFFHLAMSFASILAVVTPLAPSAVLEPYGILPVATSAFAAFVAGYLVSYWWLLFTRRADAADEQNRRRAAAHSRLVAMVGGGVLCTAYAVTLLLNLFSFSGGRGDFADRMAARVLDEVGDRTWLITDGSIDDHIRLAAAKAGRELNLINISRDLDERYLASLKDLVKAKGVGGRRNDELVLSLSLGVLSFVQDWFAADPGAGRDVAVFASPDIWYSAGVKAVPEFILFGSDPGRKVDWSPAAWQGIAEILHAPKDWGSFRLGLNRNPVERLRLNLRRHMGMVANNRGVWLQDAGRDAEALEMYKLALDTIDTDNVSALFNLYSMATADRPKGAAQERKRCEERMNKIVEDKSRRYRLWALSNYYGYIRDPKGFVDLGYAWARSGMPGAALGHIKRAIELVPAERRNAIMNMMAALYASELDAVKSREIYESVLSADKDNHDALIGMMRLELVNGNSDAALAYLERAAKAAGDDFRAELEFAMIRLMRNEFDEARAMFRKALDRAPDNVQTWSLLAAAVMQQCDASKDEAVRKRCIEELEKEIVPNMEKYAGADSYHLHTVRAFLLLRQGDDRRREARDSFLAAAKSRPDISATQDLVLGLDISLNDVQGAEQHARDVLRRNRKAPLANYVMGSIELQRGNSDAAETYLRRSVETPRPTVLALNDLAEVLRRKKDFADAERYARQAVEVDGSLYVAWETLGSVLMDAGKDFGEAEACVRKACELSKKALGGREDLRMLVSLARVQLKAGDKLRAQGTLGKVGERLRKDPAELSDFERKEFEELKERVR